MATRRAPGCAGPVPAATTLVTGPGVPRTLRAWLLVLWAAVPAAGCDQLGIVQDPLQRAEVEALGPEDPNVPIGPRHRAGQPCAVCHSPEGGAGVFTFAGTVYRDPVAQLPVADVNVTFVDKAGTTFTTKTNCVGNFYVRPNDVTLATPTWVSVQLTDFPYEMASPIHREASCAKCHTDPAGPASAGHVFLTDDETTYATIPMRACGPEDEVAR
jgi:hypothetical protein